MISVLLAMLRLRRFQALAMTLLAAAATLAAIAGPVYLASINKRVVVSEFQAATPADRTLSISGQINANGDFRGIDPSALIATVLPVRNFTWVTSLQYPALTKPIGSTKTPVAVTVVNRQDVCAHITVVTGRCMVGLGEIVLPVSLAAQLHLGVGATLPLAYATYDSDMRTSTPSGSFTSTLVVGTYLPADPGEIYWGESNYFAVGVQPPILTATVTVSSMGPDIEKLNFDAVAGQAAFTGDLDAFNSEINSVTELVRKLGVSMTTTTGIPTLIASMKANQRSASQVIPIAAAPLLILAWCVIFIASSYAAAGRRTEFAVLGLRGAPLLVRWWLAVAEPVAAICAGWLLCYAIGSLLAPINILWPAIALVGSVVAAIAAQFRSIVSSVSSMLRQAAAVVGGIGWIGQAVGILVVLLTGAAIVQLRQAGGNLTGVTVLAPGLIVLGTAVLASLTVVPIARLLGRRALRRGRTATALAAYYVGRRPGAQRLLILAAVSVGLLGFGTAGLSVAHEDRSYVARVQTGAPTVLNVDTLTRAQLLEGVRAADPAGTWAMAAASVPNTGQEHTVPTIAVDATRLGAVATWLPAYGPLSAAQIGKLLHPDGLPAPIVFAGSHLTFTATVAHLDPTANLFLNVTVLPEDGSSPVTIARQVRNGELSLDDFVRCSSGCRLRGFTLQRINVVPFRFSITMKALTIDGKPLAALSSAAQWARSPGATVADSAAGVVVTFNSAGTKLDPWLRPKVAPSPLPVVTSVPFVGNTMESLDGADLAVTDVATVAGLPRVGRSGAMMDLDFADLSASDAGAPTSPQVWLGSRAPKDAIARLAAHGIVVTGSYTTASVAKQLDDQGASLALWFHLFAAILAGGIAVGALALAAGVDRRPRATELAALRTQGVKARTIRRAASSGYVVLVVAAALVGLVAGALAWWTAGPYMPIFTNLDLWTAPRWPDAVSVAWPWVAALVVLIMVAVGIGINLRRAIARHLSP